jgi:hypothetical protein
MISPSLSRIICRGLASRAAQAAAVVVLVAGSSFPVLADEIGTMAKRLAELRGEVETLSDQLSARKSDLQEQLRSYSRQKSELELEIQREDTRVQKMQQAIAAKRAEAEAQRAAGEKVGPAFERHVVSVREYVQGTLPFRTKERLAELDKIEEQFKSGLLPPQRALNRLWSFVEDEMRMTRESGLFSQPVIVEGKEQLADIVRVGMIMMYYRTPDGQYGHAIKEGSGWSYKTIESDDGKKQVQNLFETFKKQIRVGYFTLPNALPPVVK